MFVLAAAFYMWTASTVAPLALHGAQNDPYNQLADALLHFHLWVSRAPAGLANLAEPYDPAQHAAFVPAYPDYALYGGHLYLTWGPAPALVLLVPLHLFGFEPSKSLITMVFAIVGLGFALATLRVLLRQIGKAPLWMCVLAACTVAFSSAVPFIVRFSEVYEQAIAGGFCFAMAGVWLAISAIADRRASLVRLVLMSLCFGLAAGSRPPLALLALLLIPVYMSLRPTRRGRVLLAALAVPVGGCFLLLAAYNQARFGSLLEYGTRYQLSYFDSYTAHWASLSYVPPGTWAYLMAPPQPTILFPFVLLAVPQTSYPLTLPAHYYPVSEFTGGLLPMTPIVIFIAALPWIWRRRPALLGPLALPLMVLACAGMGGLLFVSYEIFSATERYEVDFTALFLFGALAAWLALSRATRGWRRRLVCLGGGLLATWGCFTGLAISFSGYYKQLATTHSHTWATLEEISSPLSVAIAMVAGHPVLAEVSAPNILKSTPVSYTNFGSGVTAFWLSANEQADLTIVSPDNREAALRAHVSTGPELEAGASLRVRVQGPGRASYTYPLPVAGEEAQIPVHLKRGVNRLALSPLAGAVNRVNPAIPASQVLVSFFDLSLAGHY